jgi:hypothetical protein
LLSKAPLGSDAVAKFHLVPGGWAGWLQAPVGPAPWAASPVLLASVTPLKTGQGRLTVSFVQPLLPGGGRRREIELRVVQHGPEHLVGAFSEDGVHQTAVLAEPTFDWLHSYCPLLMARRPRHADDLDGEGAPPFEASWAEHLQGVFGRTEEEASHGAGRTSFGVDLKPMPQGRSAFRLDVEYGPFDSVLISCGCIPREMEDKWFILMEEDRLRFHRSWTGILVYGSGLAGRPALARRGQSQSRPGRVRRDGRRQGPRDAALDRGRRAAGRAGELPG